jgi:nitrate reductase NapAB chaperone NapD
MVICSYVVLPAPGFADTLADRISSISGCDVVRATNRDLLLVVTEAEDAESNDALRRTLERLEGVRTLALTFGEVTGPASTGSAR